MASVHDNKLTIPYQPFTTMKPYFYCNICPFTNDIVFVRFEGFPLLLFLFMREK